jgi:hypothetical protein
MFKKFNKIMKAGRLTKVVKAIYKKDRKEKRGNIQPN